jgi:hypothetical protein
MVTWGRIYYNTPKALKALVIAIRSFKVKRTRSRKKGKDSIEINR